MFSFHVETSDLDRALLALNIAPVDVAIQPEQYADHE